MLLLLDDSDAGNGAKIETYICVSSYPVLNEHGFVAGVMHEWDDCTVRVIAQRRLQTISMLETRLAETASVAEIWDTVRAILSGLPQTCADLAQILSALDTNPEDIPFAIAFSAQAQATTYNLEARGSIGIFDQPTTIEMIRKDPRVVEILGEVWISTVSLIIESTHAATSDEVRAKPGSAS